MRAWQYLDARQGLVELLAQVAGHMKLHNDTVHLSMAYIDRFRARVQVQGTRLKLAALAALAVAAKFADIPKDEEGYCLDPSFSHILVVLGNPRGITTRHLAAYERRLLEVLRWQLLAATPSSFACAYRARGIFCEDDTAGPLLDTPPTCEDQENAWQYTKFFCDLATLHGLSCTHGTSVAAAAAVAAARNVVGIQPAWPEQLAHRLGHTQGAQVDVCARAILRLYHAEHAPPSTSAPEAASTGEQQTLGSGCARVDSDEDASTSDAPICDNEDLPAQAVMRPVRIASGEDVVSFSVHAQVNNGDSVAASSPTLAPYASADSDSRRQDYSPTIVEDSLSYSCCDRVVELSRPWQLRGKRRRDENGADRGQHVRHCRHSSTSSSCAHT